MQTPRPLLLPLPICAFPSNFFRNQFDLRNLLVVNPHQVDENAMADDSEEYLKGQAQAAVQSLINR